MKIGIIGSMQFTDHTNKIEGAKFSHSGLTGLLSTYDIEIS